MLGIGIDTGGTYTDAVVFDTTQRQVLSSCKSLTTHRNLKEGILESLRKLDQDLVHRADYLALSTTLATNACVEGKGGRAKLVFMGVDQQAVIMAGASYGLPPVEQIYFLDCEPAKEEPLEREPDWEQFRTDVRESFGQYDAVALVQIFPQYNGGRFEIMAEQIIQEETDAICVRGYDLYQELNVQKRGTTALLNARLLPVMQDFFDSIDRSLEEMGLDLQIYVMKSDGSIMSKDFAMRRPVDTLLCGPAASITGALELTGMKDGMIIDMGGTTSDIGFVRNGIAVSSSAGVQVGDWHTMVKGVDIDTFALGGDSGVLMKYGELSLDDRRVIPLCIAADTWPEIREELQKLRYRHHLHSNISEMFLVCMRMPDHPDNFNAQEREILNALRERPLAFDQLAKELQTIPSMVRKKRLENEGLIMRIGITPTDVMHVRGDYRGFDHTVSEMGIGWLARQCGRGTNEICQEIYDLVQYKLYSNLTRILIRHQMGMDLGEEDQILTALMKERCRQTEPEFLSMRLLPSMPLIGTGAPTGIFLPDMETLFETDSILPEYSHVANAVGAAAGSILAEHTLRITPYKGERFTVEGGDEMQIFHSYRDALEYSKKMVQEKAMQKARDQGAEGQLHAEVQVDENMYHQIGNEGMGILIGTRVTGSVRIRLQQ